MYIKSQDEPLTISECIQLLATAVVYDIYKQDPNRPDHILLPDKETGTLQPHFIVDIATNISQYPKAQQILLKKLKAKRVIPKYVEKIKIGKTIY